MNYLGQKTMDKKQGEKLIKSIIEYDSLQIGTEPYPISLRLINIIKFISKHRIHDDKIDQILWHWVCILKRNIEYHLMGNHLMENGAAMLFGAVYFDDLILLKRAKRILSAQLQEQILKDGGHFELSPMYHSILLYRLLDCYNMLINNDVQGTKQLKQSIQQQIPLMLGWLQQITWDNGSFPMVNDSTEQIAPTSDELISYAQRLHLTSHVVPLSDSGYRVYNFGNYRLFCDMGKIGPDYIPGHAHNDIFNFILHIKGKPFIVDTGISTYELADRRQEERSTSAHNTIYIAPNEQTETWAQFRVARRGHPVMETDLSNECSGVYAYPYKKIVHKRSFKTHEMKIQMSDFVNVQLPARAFLHFHEDVSITIQNNEIITNLANLKFEGESRIYISHYKRAHAFNQKIKAPMVVIEFNKMLKTTIQIIK